MFEDSLIERVELIGAGMCARVMSHDVGIGRSSDTSVIMFKLLACVIKDLNKQIRVEWVVVLR